MDRDNISIQTIIGVIFVIAALAIVPAVISVLNDSVDNQVTTKSLVEEASYIIYKDGDNTCLKNGTSGRIIYRSDNSSAAIQLAADEIVSYTKVGTIYIRNTDTDLKFHGTNLSVDYIIDSTITIHPGVSIESDGAILDASSLNDVVLDVNPLSAYINGYNVRFSGFSIFADRDNVNTLGMNISGYYSGLTVDDVQMRYVHDGIVLNGNNYITSIRDCWILGSYASFNGTYGLDSGTGIHVKNSSNGLTVDSCDVSGFANGVVVDGGLGVTITNNYLEWSDVCLDVSVSAYVAGNLFQARPNGICVNVSSTARIVDNFIMADLGSVTGVLGNYEFNSFIVQGNRINLADNGIGINSTVRCRPSFTDNVIYDVDDADPTTNSAPIRGIYHNGIISNNVIQTSQNITAISINCSAVTINGNSIALYYGEINGTGLEYSGDWNMIGDNSFRNIKYSIIQNYGTGNKVVTNSMNGSQIIIAGGDSPQYYGNFGFTSEFSSMGWNGTGAQMAIPHHLSGTPSLVMVWDIDSGANVFISASADDTYIYVNATYGKVFGWWARL